MNLSNEQTKDLDSKVYTFMIKVTVKNSEITDYTWLNGKPSHLDTYVRIEDTTLKNAVDRVKEIYSDKRKYYVIAEDSYMLIELGDMNK